MKPIIFRINDKTILDSYIYSGYLIIVTTDGIIKVLPLTKLFYSLYNSYNNYKTIFELALLRNDWLDNLQACCYFHSSTILNELELLWNSAYENIFECELQDDDWKSILELDEMPIYDIKAYGLKLYLASKKSLLEIPIDINKHFNIKQLGKPHKVFDERIIFINAFSGEFTLSAGNNGLFHGSIWNEDSSIIVNEIKVLEKSFRTMWSGYDVINYESQSKFNYIRNEVIKTDRRLYKYSNIDEIPYKKRISKFFVEQIGMAQFIDNEELPINEISYCFNTGHSLFYVMNNGKYFWSNISKSDKDNIHQSRIIHELPQYEEFVKNNEILNFTPISASSIINGTVLELYDKTLLYHNSFVHIINDKPSISVRTFPSSKRFKRLICIVDEEGISLISVPPSGKELIKRKPERSSGNSSF